MPLIELETIVRAPVERCFDLARSIDLHMVSAGKTAETAIAGRLSGLIEANETVTWRARHLGLRQELTVRITAFDRPHHFQDVMIKGAFASMRHDHHFKARDGATVMLDRFDYRSPLGPLGALADRLFLEGYMRRFLTDRARIVKETAEGEAWRQFLSPDR
jgi:ligand-binding SRPBCC domain-containing protein